MRENESPRSEARGRAGATPSGDAIGAIDARNAGGATAAPFGAHEIARLAQAAVRRHPAAAVAVAMAAGYVAARLLVRR